MTEKKYIDPTLKKQSNEGKEYNPLAMTKRRGRPKKGEGKTPAKPAHVVSKHVRFTEKQWKTMEKIMVKNQAINFSEYARISCFKLRPVIIDTDDFTELRKARRDIINYINATSEKNLTEEQRKELFSNMNVLEDWGEHLKKVVLQIDRLIDRIHNKIIIKDPGDDESSKEEYKEELV